MGDREGTVLFHCSIPTDQLSLLDWWSVVHCGQRFNCKRRFRDLRWTSGVFIITHQSSALLRRFHRHHFATPFSHLCFCGNRAYIQDDLLIYKSFVDTALRNAALFLCLFFSDRGRTLPSRWVNGPRSTALVPVSKIKKWRFMHH